jgi:hypothetical protein
MFNLTLPRFKTRLVATEDQCDHEKIECKTCFSLKQKLRQILSIEAILENSDSYKIIGIRIIELITKY